MRCLGDASWGSWLHCSYRKFETEWFLGAKFLKKRLDVMLVERGLATGRDKAKAMIMAGQVYVDTFKADKPGTEYLDDILIEVRGGSLRYVSRGGLKLARALECFPIDLQGAVCADIGASTGGFTDCMLQNGASKVYAIDVGYGQLAWKLRQDERVVVMERTNIRHVKPEQLEEQPDFLSVDVSFISLALVFPVAKHLLGDGGSAVCLVKPQFEAGRDKVGKKGVVRDASTHREVLETVISSAVLAGFCPSGLTYSPVRGPEGNIEYLLWLKNKPEDSRVDSALIRETVNQSHHLL